ncbi:haloacid dehalogenase-like hydrolase domain-containing protein 2 [Nematostella vectensis]|uniref:haloacid dehalogenase-like hydrolase domain-containing protein 2 n=1 Tax=Nematostella vectensis TaxID=45351 RepID=UPI002076F015|nr:haloacid dehalogenase-like hydrolase domain-containing protein 2 [Nematostella vectensis]
MAACIRGVLVDLSGTIHIENSVIPRSIEALKKLRQTGLPLRFVTNTTKESKLSLLQRLTKIGFDIKADEIFSSLTAAVRLVRTRELRPLLLLQPDAKTDFAGISTDNPNAVVVGLAPDCFNYETLNKAFRLLLDGGKLIAIHKVQYYKRSDGLVLGPGPFVSALEYATDVQAEVVGKPQALFFKQVLTEIKCDPECAVMIGDDVRNDVEGAQAAGIKGILVKTGKYRHGDESKLSQPAFAVCQDFLEAVELIIKHTKVSKR